MKQDRENQYAGAQALTVSVASTDLIDHGIDRNLGLGEPMCVVITLDVAADATDNDETYTAKLQTDSDLAFGSATDVGETVTITRGDAAGSRYIIPIPADTKMERFSRLYFTLGGSTPTVTVTARLMPQRLVQSPNVFFAKGYTIS
jgi:hypothetical protein